MPIYALGDHEPQIHPDVYVHPDAVVIGRESIGAVSTIWPGAVLRGDFGDIHMEGCVVEDRCLIGSGSIVLNRSHVGARSVVGAQALVAEDTQIPDGSMALGVPARVRPIDPAKQQEWIDVAARGYVDSGRVCAKDLRLVSARTHARPGKGAS
jgi:carbonic anhydrase/acetyltransferase-like protein (isoleucine patch superfamily)